VLRVRRNLLVGLAAGVALGGGLWLVRVLELLGPAPDRASPVLFAGLAVVLAVSAAGLVATALTLVTAVRVARDVDGAAEE
jgi:hypothetical protein